MSFLSSSRLRVGLMLSAFALVCVTGGLVFGFLIGKKHERDRNNPATWNVQVMKGLRWKLKPDAEQVKKFQAVVDHAAESVQQIRDRATKEADASIDVFVTDLRKELRPDQIAGFEDLMKTRVRANADVLRVQPPKSKEKK